MTDLAGISGLADAIVQPQIILPSSLIRGTVTATSGQTVTVVLGDKVSHVTMKRLDGVLPQVNDQVYILQTGTDMIIIGRTNSGSEIQSFDNYVVVPSLNVGPGHVMNGDGWYRSGGQTGWYSTTYGYGLFCAAADGLVRSYPDSFGGGSFYSATEVRGGSACQGGWESNTGYACWYHTAHGTGRTGDHAGYCMLSDGPNTYVNANTSLHLRTNNVDGLVIGQAFGTLGSGDVHMPNAATPINGVFVTMATTGSWQVGTLGGTSSVRYKKDVAPYTGGADNPLWSITPVTFLWDEDTVINGKESNIMMPEGQVGFIAEHVNLYAPDAVKTMAPGGSTIEDLERVMADPDDSFPIVEMNQNAMIAYLVDACQYLKAKNDDLQSQVDAHEAQLNTLQTYMDQLWQDFYKNKPPF